MHGKEEKREGKREFACLYTMDVDNFPFKKKYFMLKVHKYVTVCNTSGCEEF